MDNSARLDYNWIPYDTGEDVEHTNLLFKQWIDENPDQYTVQVSYPRSGRHWLHAMLDNCAWDQTLPLRWIDESYQDVKYLFVHPMEWPEFDERLKYVLLIRDPRDAILSAIKFRDGYWNQEFWEKQCIWYKQMTEMFLHLNTIVVQYERLCLFPVWELERIFNFAQLNIVDGYENRIWQEVVKSDGYKYESGTSVPIKYDNPITSKKRYDAHCLKWKQDEEFLNKGYHHIIWAHLIDLMLHFGYTYQGHSTNLLTR